MTKEWPADSDSFICLGILWSCFIVGDRNHPGAQRYVWRSQGRRGAVRRVLGSDAWAAVMNGASIGTNYSSSLEAIKAASAAYGHGRKRSAA